MTDNRHYKDEKYLSLAIELAVDNVKNGGGPFGAVVVKDGVLISEGKNLVTHENDPTAHAEVIAIRKAADKLGSHSLEGCTIYSSTEPCPMCLGAIYWAGIKEIVFASNKNDAERAGFIDAHIYREMRLEYEKRSIKTRYVNISSSGDEFAEWEKKEDKEVY